MSKNIKTFFSTLLARFIAAPIATFYILIKNLKGSLLGGWLGYYFYLQYEAGLLFQRQTSRALLILGIQHDVFLRMIFFIALFSLLGAALENKLRGGK